MASHAVTKRWLRRFKDAGRLSIIQVSAIDIRCSFTCLEPVGIILLFELELPWRVTTYESRWLGRMMNVRVDHIYADGGAELHEFVSSSFPLWVFDGHLVNFMRLCHVSSNYVWTLFLVVNGMKLLILDYFTVRSMETTKFHKFIHVCS